MELINATRMTAGYTLGLEPSGRELLVVVIKGTFRMPGPENPPGQLMLAEEQLPLVMSDTFTGEPGLSAPVYEVDFAPHKHACDILLLGSAHAPRGRPATRVEVGVRVGNWTKSMAVVGPRHWQCGVSGISASPPGAFVRQPISYDVAFGGVDLRHEDPAQHAAYMANPVGRGFHRHIKSAWVDGEPLPSTEEAGQAVSDPAGAYRPMAFGPVGRQWSGRMPWAGTYDDDWLENHFPFLPPDFDERYYQAAPQDQQIPIPQRALDVSLVNLTPDGSRQFTLPFFEAPVHVFPKRGERHDYLARLDTVVLEPDLSRVSMSWRVAHPIRRSIHEIDQVLVGKKGREWWQKSAPIPFPLPVTAAPPTAVHGSASA